MNLGDSKSYFVATTRAGQFFQGLTHNITLFENMLNNQYQVNQELHLQCANLPAQMGTLALSVNQQPTLFDLRPPSFNPNATKQHYQPNAETSATEHFVPFNIILINLLRRLWLWSRLQ